LILLNPQGKGMIQRDVFLISSGRKVLRWARLGSINDAHEIVAFQYWNNCKRPSNIIWTLEFEGNQRGEVREHIGGSGRGGCHRIEKKKREL